MDKTRNMILAAESLSAITRDVARVFGLLNKQINKIQRGQRYLRRYRNRGERMKKGRK